MALVRLCELIPGQEADFFSLLSAKEELSTREGKPFWRVTFRDANREVSFPIWDNSPWAADCRDRWTAGMFFKLRASLKETNYGPQLEIRRVREVVEADTADGFDQSMCLPQSRFDPVVMFDDLAKLLKTHCKDAELRGLVASILRDNHEELLRLSAARRNHHAYAGGWLEHTLSVTRNAVFFAEKYAAEYPDLTPPLDKSMVVAGAILHDIGKLREIDQQPGAISYTPAGELIGHILLGRDIVREAAAKSPINADTLLRLEHLIIAHQRLPEWGSPKPPMTPEALLVHFADDVDAKFHMAYAVLRGETGDNVMTTDKNPMRQKFYRGDASNAKTK